MQKYMMSALALAVVSPAAPAQSSLTVYGVADAGLVLEHGGDSGAVQKIGSGVASSSRLGFKGREDLGGGTALTFVLENGYSIDTGATKQNGALFGRQALLCVSGEAGSFSIGRQYTPFYKALNNVADPFATGMAGNTQNIFDGTTRIDNTVEYITPRVAGFAADVQYGFGETAGDSSKSRSIGASGSYEQGALTVVLAHQQRDNPAGTAHSHNTMLAARYRFGAITGHTALARNRDLLGIESRDALLGMTAQFSATDKLLFSLIDHHDKSAAQQHARQAAIGYSHALSRRTDLYAAYGHIRNSNGALFRVGTAADSGSGTTGVNLGVRHVF
ncbi:porin [Duganella sp. FT135W]|uniref:Porin n=1 Tax=Duganella flavida TaxID=2692175 RepID=A0A6L8KGG5_9BURK|nr:porin [Duganella flavida]MYM24912.1 porin [Duganella flavida]